MNTSKIIIAIDGPASSGKSTLAKDLAAKLKYRYVDTGAMYRAITLFSIQEKLEAAELDMATLAKVKIDFAYAEDGSQKTLLNGEDVSEAIRTMEVSQKVSEVSAQKAVRTFLLEQQRSLGKSKGLVMDGRDIGTVIFPDAALKIFMTTPAEVRAERRYAEMKAKGQEVTYDAVLENVRQRDLMDAQRSESPLKKAKDAKTLNNAELDRNTQLNKVLEWVENATEA